MATFSTEVEAFLDAVFADVNLTKASLIASNNPNTAGHERQFAERVMLEFLDGIRDTASSFTNGQAILEEISKMDIRDLIKKSESIPVKGTIPTIVSAVVENADPDALVVTFSEAMVLPDITGWSLDFAVGTAKGISSVSGSGTVWTFALDGDIVNGDDLDLDYDPATGRSATKANGAELAAGTSADVTNNVA